MSPAYPSRCHPVDRHPEAVRRTLTWADESANRGDHADALAWLAVIQAVDGTLPDDYETKRAKWLRSIEPREQGS